MITIIVHNADGIERVRHNVELPDYFDHFCGSMYMSDAKGQRLDVVVDDGDRDER